MSLRNLLRFLHLNFIQFSPSQGFKNVSVIIGLSAQVKVYIQGLKGYSMLMAVDPLYFPYITGTLMRLRASFITLNITSSKEALSDIFMGRGLIVYAAL